MQTFSYQQTLNIGNKVENLETNDSYMIPYLKAVDCLKHVFEGKLNNEGMQILKKELDDIKITD